MQHDVASLEGLSSAKASGCRKSVVRGSHVLANTLMPEKSQICLWPLFTLCHLPLFVTVILTSSATTTTTISAEMQNLRDKTATAEGYRDGTLGEPSPNSQTVAHGCSNRCRC